MKKIFLLEGLLIILLLSLASCNSSNLTITKAWARAAGLGETSAIYFEVNNPTSQSDSLISASTNVADMVQLHQTQMNAEGVMTMQHQHEIEIPANSNVTFAPGGYHIMLMGLRKELKPGDTFNLKLTFKKAGTIEVTVSIKSP